MRKNTVLKEVSKIATQNRDFMKKIAKFTNENKAEKNKTPAKNRFDDLWPLLNKRIKIERIIPKMQIYVKGVFKNIIL
jgi:hypothetical protein